PLSMPPMKRTDRFTSLADLRLERARLKAVRDGHRDALLGYWELIHEKEFRRGLAGDAFGDMLRAWKPLRTLTSFIRSGEGPMGNVLGLMMGSRARTFKGRLFGWAVGLIAPLILKKVVSPDRMENIVHEL